MLERKKVERLFSEEGVKYRVPIYQRHYVWDERNWNHIWDDIKETTEEESKLLHQAETLEVDIIQADSLVHFTGVIVIREDKEDKTYEIIDGQQRLTTFQIIFCVIRDLSLEAGDRDTAKSADKLILDESGDELDPNDQFKLLPTVGADQEAFRQLASGSAAQSSGRIREAYEHFKQVIKDYVAEGGESISNLFKAFLHHFEVVQMLSVVDNQGAKIFESINGRGIALAQFDHLRNNVFLRAGVERNRLYNGYWRHFDSEEDWLSNTFVDPFLEDFLKAKLGSRFNDRLTLFDSYQRDYRKDLQKSLGDYHEENSRLVEHEFEELQRYSHIYTEIINCDWEDSMWFYKFLATDFENTDWHPLILVLKGERDDLRIVDSNLELTFRILESYIVRRMLCYGPKQSIPRNKNFVMNLISTIKDQDVFDVGKLVRYLNKHRFPTNKEVKNALSKAGTRNAQLIRYILFKIEHWITNHRYSDAQPNFEMGLSLEHVMPGKWESNKASWSVTSGNYHEQARKRNACLQSIGNLTLLSGDLNHEAGNKSFNEKKSLYDDHSSLRITREILRYDSWDVHQIREREESLSKRFFEIWQSATEFLREIGEPEVESIEIEQTDQVHQGAVKWLGPKGFGYITPDTDLPNQSANGVFVHFRDFPQAKDIDLSGGFGQRVVFRTIKDASQEHIRASDVRLL